MPSSLATPIYTDVRAYLGDDQIPREIKNQRRSTVDAMRYVGTPVLLKRMYTPEDADLGVAQKSPNMDSTYKQARHADPLSYGVGYCSIDTQPGEWYDPATGNLFVTGAAAPPQTSYLAAPRYRGYGPGFLTYAILPDRPEDVFKITTQGVMVRTQNAKVQLPWWPLVGDNDLMVVVDLDDHGMIANTYERYQLKMVTPITMRGMDRRGRREITGANAGGNRYWIGQECEAVKVPTFDPIYQVEVDR